MNRVKPRSWCQSGLMCTDMMTNLATSEYLSKKT